MNYACSEEEENGKGQEGKERKEVSCLNYRVASVMKLFRSISS